MPDYDTCETMLIGCLTSKESGVYLIDGKWGSGKTHLYRETLKKLREENSYFKQTLPSNFNKYSHVSLFGLKDIDDLKFGILGQAFFEKQGKIYKLFTQLRKANTGSKLLNLSVNASTIMYK